MTIRLPWHIAGLLAVGVVAVVLAVLAIGPRSTSAARTETELVTAERGLVQSTVTGDGNVAAGVDDDVDFQTSGTLRHVYVHQGEHVAKGQLLATLDPSSEQLTVKEDELSLASAEDSLKNAEDEMVSTTDTAATVDCAEREFASYTPSTPTTTAAGTETTPTAPSTETTATTPTTAGVGSAETATATTTTTMTVTEPAATTPAQTETTPAQTTADSSSSGGASSGTTAASKASDVASAESSVDQARATLHTARQAIKETRLYAPASGTIVSVEGLTAGDAVTGSSGTSSSTSSSGTSDSSTAASAAGASTASSSTDTSSSTAFAEIVNSRKLTMTVSFDESDISEIKVGEPATVTIEALTGVELGAKVTSISTVGTDTSDVVTYDATLTLDQHDAKVKPGMTADAAVITTQASGVTLPTDAVTGTGSTATLEVVRNGTAKATTVDIGVRGDDRVQIVGGLKAGQQVRISESLPSTGTSTSSSSAAASSSAASALGGVGGAAGGFGGAAGGGAPAGGGGFGGR